LQEGFVLMQSVAKYLLPDLGAAETAYIAAETALVAGHVDEAVNYLNMAISGNPTIGRIHALQAAALGLAGRSDDARKEAERAHLLSPKYTPEVMSKRGGPTVGAKYAAARDVFVAAFRAARGNGVTN
jgi:Flp pilus assembly protein TadD